jgi:Protein of unknown function (DUF2924)
MTDRIANEITTLPGKSKTQLLLLWKENFGQAPPNHLRKELMVPILAYRIQEKEYGDLSKTARKKLTEIAHSLSTAKRPHRSINAGLKTGTRLVRSWKGQVHEVSVSADGFEYRGQHFQSLSTIAREITGTRWSGPLFFGTRKSR